MSKSTIPQIEFHPLESLIIDEGYNPRIALRFKENVKELAEQVEAAGGIDATNHHVTVVPKKDGLHVRDGHTLLAVAKLRGETHVPVMRKEMTVDEELYGPIHRNSGHPLSAFEQGTIYIRARDGQKAEDLAVGEEIRAPKTTKQIAKDAGYSEQHIKNCIAIRESSERIGALIENEAISSSVVLLAKNLASEKVEGEMKLSEPKQYKIIQAAIANARKEDRATASKQDFDAVKSDFAKPLKAATPPKAVKTPEAANGTPGPETSANAESGASGHESEASGQQSEEPASEQQGDGPTIGDANPALELFQASEQAEELPANVKAKDSAKLRASILAAINSADEQFHCDLDDKQIDGLTEAVSKAVIVFLSPI